MKLLQFDCDTTGLSKYTDSMLFSSGTEIAHGTFEHEGKKLNISLQVRGDVDVTYNGKTYHDPKDFPEELKELIHKYPNDWMWAEVDDLTEEDDDSENYDILVGSSNGFEYVFEEDSEIYGDELSNAIPEEIKEDMTAIASQYFGID